MTIAFGKKLKMALNLSGMTQRELADKANMTEAAVSRYISGTRQPNFDQLKKLCRVLNVSADWLLDVR